MKLLAFAFFCLLASLFILLSDPSFTYLLLDNKEASEPTRQLFAHFVGMAEIPVIFNEQERAHLADVTLLIRIAFFAMLALGFYLFRNNWQQTTRRGNLLLLALIIMAALIPFDSLFTTFHQIFFPQGNWQFSPDSTLIAFYPFTFFTHYAIAIAAYSLIVAGTLTLFSFVIKKG